MKKLLYALMAFFILFMSMLMFSGCNTYQKQLGKFQAFAMQHDGELAKLCATVFPAKDSVGKTDTSIRRADNKNLKGAIDSIQHRADSLTRLLEAASVDKTNPCATVASEYQKKLAGLNNQIKTLSSTYRPCKPDTVKLTTTVYKVDMASLKVIENTNAGLHDSLKVVNTKLSASNDQASSRLKYIFILGGILVVLVGLKLFGKI